MIWISETYVNRTENVIFGESEVFETFTDKIGVLFRDLQQEYGRCVSKQYVDKADGRVVQTGWVFQKVMRYEDARDAKDTYLREVWVTLHEAPPEHEVTYHVMEIPA